jgi:hypothetical protein
MCLFFNIVVLIAARPLTFKFQVLSIPAIPGDLSSHDIDDNSEPTAQIFPLFKSTGVIYFQTSTFRVFNSQTFLSL